MEQLSPSAGIAEAAQALRSTRTRSAGPCISLSHLSKSFKLPHRKVQTLKERALHPLQTRTFDVLAAVNDVSVEITKGEFFGIVGRNGSGKSTLLKCLAGIYGVDSGELVVRGRLAPFIELGVGFNPELTARDNAIINAIMLGLTRSEAAARFDDIVTFAELEEFMDLRLKNYSSGMQVRLAFSVAVQVDAEILLIDEVLAVGDASFQQKCFDEFTRLKAEGRTIVFVTHDMGSVERFCDRAMLMERGRVIDIGSPESIARQYNDLNFRRVREEAKAHGGPEIFRKDPVAQVVNAVFESPDGNTLVSSQQGEPVCVRMEVRFHAPAEDPIFAIMLCDEAGHALFAANTHTDGIESGRFQAGDSATVRVRFDNWLGVGRIRLNATIARKGFGADVFDLHSESSLIVLASHPGGGAVDLPHTIELDRHR
jgi:ABC-type polysaccharide/polyol phosphate transport system ATPase subunit